MLNIYTSRPTTPKSRDLDADEGIMTVRFGFEVLEIDEAGNVLRVIADDGSSLTDFLLD